MSWPFDDSRRLTGFNLYFDAPGAVLETHGVSPDEATLRVWRERVDTARHALGWAGAPVIQPPVVVRRHASGASLAFAAPADQLYSATEVNEWAWLAALRAITATDVGLHAPGHPAAWDDHSALCTLRAFAAAERRPDLLALLQAAAALGLAALTDDEALTLGEGCGGQTWPLSALPVVDAVPWAALHNIPVALVTGSNGKTTTVRLLAAMTRAHGWHSGHSCTDGVFVDGVAIEAGDYSGPAGARVVLRQPQVEAAVLETARGGILRRGLAVQYSNVAVVTNVSDDHFGEFGIHDLAGLAAAKLTVARTLGADGTLVLNADDPLLVEQAATSSGVRAWFALNDAHPLLQEQRKRGGSSCGVRDGRLRLFHRGIEHDLGAVAQMPLTFGGSARYNIANMAAVALAAIALGISAVTIATVLMRFGAAHADNPGRLQHWRLGGVQVFLDYAHNPEGLRGLLQVATDDRHGRLGVILGQAGNRGDADIRELAAVAASFQPQQVVLKDIAGMLRGRAAGEVAGILRDELLRQSVAAAAVIECLEEIDAVRHLLSWVRDGDTLVLPIHGSKARQTAIMWLDDLLAQGWRAGMPLSSS